MPGNQPPGVTAMVVFSAGEESEIKMAVSALASCSLPRIP